MLAKGNNISIYFLREKKKQKSIFFYVFSCISITKLRVLLEQAIAVLLYINQVERFDKPSEIKSITKEHDAHRNSNGNRQWLEHRYKDRSLQVQSPCVNSIVQA